MPSFNCFHPTCATIIPQRGYCPAHAHLARPSSEYDRTRRDRASKRFYDSVAWKRTRANKLARNPVCERCKRKLAEHVHHIRPVKEVRDTEPELLFDFSNLQSLCAPCHNRMHDRQ